MDEDQSVRYITDVLARRSRRAIFADKHSELSYSEMLASFAVCRVDLQEWSIKMPLSDTVKDAYYAPAGSSRGQDR